MKLPPMAIKNRSILLLAWTLLLTGLDPTGLQAQSTDSVANRKLRKLGLITAGAYSAAMIGLNEVWYSDFPRSDFHFFNDNREWKQLDKVGHFYSAFHLSNTGIHLLKNSGIPDNKAHLLGRAIGSNAAYPY